VRSHFGKWKSTPTPTGSIFGMGPSVEEWPSFGRLHKNGAGAFGAGSILVESILVDGKAANIAMQATLLKGHTSTESPMPKMLPVGGTFRFPEHSTLHTCFT